MKVVLGSDYKGMKLKDVVKQHLSCRDDIELVDLSETPHDDFVDSTLAVASEVLKSEDVFGILFDEFGDGSFICACKVKGLVAAEISDERSAYMTREHNNAKVICLGSEIVGDTLACNITDQFLASNYAAGRHQIRVDMLNRMA